MVDTTVEGGNDENSGSGIGAERLTEEGGAYKDAEGDCFAGAEEGKKESAVASEELS